VSHHFGKPSTQGEAGTSVGLVLFQAKSDTSLVGIGEREGGRLTIHLGRPGVRCAPATSHIESFFTGAFSECAERSGAIEGEINSMAREWWTSLKSAVLKAQDRKEIDPAADARRVSFDLNGILMAAHWAFLVEKDPRIFGEGRIAVRAKLESLATSRIPASAFKSENAWKEYLKGKHVQEKEKPLSALRRLGGKQASSGDPSPLLTKPPEKKSAFDGLRRLTQK
jgi:hypothetical protein